MKLMVVVSGETTAQKLEGTKYVERGSLYSGDLGAYSPQQGSEAKTSIQRSGAKSSEADDIF
jgi:hypothetical protein